MRVKGDFEYVQDIIKKDLALLPTFLRRELLILKLTQSETSIVLTNKEIFNFDEIFSAGNQITN